MKALVIAGTHTRENEFSFRTIDALLGLHKINSRPQVFLGEDGARRGLLWDVNDKLALAKVERIGPISKDYAMQMSEPERLLHLVHTLTFGAGEYEPAYSYKTWGQFSSVHQILIDSSKADFYIDLHSYHLHTQDMTGTALYIRSAASAEQSTTMATAFNEAQATEPWIYGNGKVECPDEYRIRREIKKAHPIASDVVVADLAILKLVDMWQNNWFYFNGNKDTKPTSGQVLDACRTANQMRFAAEVLSVPQQISLLTGEPNSRSGLYDTVRSALYETKERPLREDYYDYAIQFCRETKNRPNHFLFEAVTWRQDQQGAVARFISNYLLPYL